MLRTRQINADPHARSLHSTLAVAANPVREAAWNLEERVVWRGADFLRAIVDVIRWPLERIAWVAERHLLWPVQERTGSWSLPLRVGGTVALALLVGGIATAGALSIASNGGDGVTAREVSAAVAPQASPQAPTEPAPVLHGAPPVFSEPVDGTGGVKAAASEGAKAEGAHSASATVSEASIPAASADPGEIAGAAALDAARRFSDAFVLYETGQTDAGVRAAFHATATRQLATSLLHRPPRLPADVNVPKAKVLNVVPGPQLRNDCTVSVSLLRVGVTSELRLSLHRDKGQGWKVKDVLG